MNDTIFVPYIFVKDEFGYVHDTKFKQEIDRNNLPKVGDEITSFYDEKFAFFNFCCLKLEDNQEYIIKNNKLVEVSEVEARETIIALFNDFLSMLSTVKCVDLHTKIADYEDSNYEKLKQGLEKALNVTFDIKNDIPFNFKALQDIENELFLYSSLDNPGINSIVAPAIKGVNTILAMNHIIDNVDNDRMFYHYREDSCYDGNEENKLGLDYTSASQGIRSIDKIAYIIQTRTPKFKK